MGFQENIRFCEKMTQTFFGERSITNLFIKLRKLLLLLLQICETMNENLNGCFEPRIALWRNCQNLSERIHDDDCMKT
jgi:hypothetical protein